MLKSKLLIKMIKAITFLTIKSTYEILKLHGITFSRVAYINNGASMYNTFSYSEIFATTSLIYHSLYKWI
jgi:hypothetical protein